LLGQNNSGQPGTGNTTDQVIPAQVAKLTNVSAIAAGNHGIHTCALRVNGAPQCWGANNAGQIGDGTTNNRSLATQVPSFTFNVDPDVVLSATGRIARVMALANCPAGAQAQIRVELELGIVSGVGQTIGECTGGLTRYPVVVPAFGRDSFLTGTGQAVADAVVKDRGQIIEVEEWTRQVSATSD
jgi:Regulator of chromosome condensation (RCC1) repeat